MQNLYSGSNSCFCWRHFLETIRLAGTVKMAFVKLIVSIIKILAVVCFVTISDGFADITCPKLVAIEEGSTAVVACNTTGKTTSLAYWYIGDSATTKPILRLENGKLGGTKYGVGYYNISSSGEMIITNATTRHEALYTVLMYFTDDTDVSKHITVNITVSPLPLCPVIDVCSPCEKCTLSVNDTGTLTCSIVGVRPLMPLKWIIKFQDGIGVVEHLPIIVHDVSSNTWNSSIQITYKVRSCHQEASFQCVAQDDLSLLKHSDSSIRIHTGNCTGKTPDSNGMATAKVVTFVVIFVGIVAATFVIMYIIKNRCTGQIFNFVWQFLSTGVNLVICERKR